MEVILGWVVNLLAFPILDKKLLLFNVYNPFFDFDWIASKLLIACIYFQLFNILNLSEHS